MRRVLLALVIALATALATSGCTAAPAERRVTVFAAASLTRVFTALGSSFENAHPGVKVAFTFDGSSGLVDQLKGGARGDVFASADEKSMTNAVTAKLTGGDPVVFARNWLTLVVPPDNPGRITGLNSSLNGKKLVVCGPEVPCGSATNTLAAKLKVTLKPVSQESKVTDVLGKVVSGEADAGVVYVTDAAGAAGTVKVIGIDGADQVVNNYPIVVLGTAPEPELAAQFVTLVRSAEGVRALTGAGFLAP